MCTAETDEGVKVKPQIEHEVTLQGKYRWMYQQKVVHNNKSKKGLAEECISNLKFNDVDN